MELQPVKLNRRAAVTALTNVCGELHLPELGTRLGIGRVAASRMPMPEAAVHQDDGAVLGKDEVRPAVDVL